VRLDELSEEELKHEQHVSEQLKIARVYKDEKSVKEIFWDYEKKHFRVNVERYRQTFTVDIKPDHQLNITSVSCSCGGGSRLCVHALTAFLQMNEYDTASWLTNREAEYKKPVTGGLSRRETEQTARVLQSFESLFIPGQEYETTEGREELTVQYAVKLYPSYYERVPGTIEVELKIGVGKLYIVKDIRELLEAIDNGEALRFTKLFTYHPADHTFKERDSAMLDRIRELMDVQTMHSTFYERNKETRRSFEIPSPYALEFLKDLSQMNTIVDDQVREHSSVHMEKLSKPFEFSVRKAENEEGLYQLYWSKAHELLYFGAAAKLCFYKGVFYYTSGEKLRILHTLYYTLAMEDEAKLSFTDDHLEQLASVLLPQLREVGKVEMDEAIEASIDMPPLKPKLKLQHEGRKMTASVVFQYGEKTIDPFKEEPLKTETVLVRDMKQEYRLLALIEEAPFKYNGEDLFLDSLADILYFMSSWLPVLSESFEVYAPKSLQELLYEPDMEPQLEASVAPEGGWMDISFDFEGISDSEVTEVMKALVRRENFYQLDSGAYVPLQGEAFQGVRSLVEDLDMKESDMKEEMQIPLYKAFQLDDADFVPVKKSAEFKQLLTRLLEPEEHDFELPDDIDASLRDYQKRGYQWMTSLDYYGFGGILADDMGLGKTLQTITFLAGKKARQSVKDPVLIICPSSVIYNWQKEIERFAPNLSSVIVTGSKAERDAQFAGIDQYDICITSYPVLRRDEEMYAAKRFSTLILDEAQYVKNSITKTAKAVRSIESGTSFALSGTPIENSLEELYSIFRIVLPGVFPKREIFRNMQEAEC
jgi:hypothetical protein